MKKFVALFVVIMMFLSFGSIAEEIDISALNVDQLEDLRTRIDTQLSALRKVNAKDYVQILDYAEYVRNQAAHEDEKVMLYGKVVQSIREGSDSAYRIALDDDYNKMFYVQFDNVPDSVRVLEDEFVSVYGRFVGDWSYDSLFGSSVTIPGIMADDIVPGVVRPVINANFDGTRNEPIPVGETARFPGAKYGNDAVVNFTASAVERGKSALAQVKKFSRYNSNPKKGKEYLVITLDVEVISSPSGKATLSDYYFKFVKSSGIEYESSYVSGVEPALSDMYPGASQTVFLVGLVDVGDEPYLVYSADEEAPIWFGPLLATKTN